MIKDLFNIIVVIPLLMGCVVIAIFVTRYTFDYIIIWTPSFFETPEEIAWVEEMSSKKIDFYNEPWAKQSTVTISEDTEEYASPSKNYRLNYIPLDGSTNGNKGFYITDNRTGKVVLESSHWIIHASEVKWIFEEKYIAYTHVEEDGIDIQREYVYVGSLKTGEIARLTTTTKCKIFSGSSSSIGKFLSDLER